MFAGGATLIVYSSLGQRSGGHINPAVTLSFWILNKIKTIDAIIYMGMQFSGAVLGAYCAFLLFGEMAQSVHLGITSREKAIQLFMCLFVKSLLLLCSSQSYFCSQALNH